jgi:Flp pilus assembly protein TadD
MDAIREQQTALSLVPNDADGWNNLGALHMRAEQPAAARRDFEQALVVAPDHAAAKANLQRLQARQ